MLFLSLSSGPKHLGMMFFAFVLIPLSFTLSLDASSWQHQIYVDSENGVDSESCWDGGWPSPCPGLNMALKGTQHYIQPLHCPLHPARELLLKEQRRDSLPLDKPAGHDR